MKDVKLLRLFLKWLQEDRVDRWVSAIALAELDSPLGDPVRTLDAEHVDQLIKEFLKGRIDQA